MILGATTFAHVHVIIKLIGTLSGFVVLFGLIGSKRLGAWTAVSPTTNVLGLFATIKFRTEQLRTA